ncbi:unnamed protein product [Meloidogyne enterolobii]|uniref:Uncharacterized protein n=1 Tax=Meloidogyne enterolobii TaxID=390850 RepID=A0ACB0Z4P5_MELEN
MILERKKPSLPLGKKKPPPFTPKTPTSKHTQQQSTRYRPNPPLPITRLIHLYKNDLDPLSSSY